MRTDADIQRGDRFVCDDELGAQRKRAGNADALPLASAEFVRIALECRFIKTNGTQQLGNTFATGGGATLSGKARKERSAHRLVNNQRLGDHVFDAHAGIERAEWILKNDLHVAAELPHFAVRGGEQIAPVETNTAGGRFNQSQNQASQRALT